MSAQSVAGRIFQRPAHGEPIVTRFPRRVWRERPNGFAIPQSGLALDETIFGAFVSI
jgi:hypothetical protein